MYNTIIAAGHLVKDPETRQTSTGKTICTFRMCISDNSAKNKCFIDVESWEKTAEVCAKYLKKGREVIVDGELSLSTWTGKDGSTQNKNFIKADRVKFLSSGGKKESGDADAPQSDKAPSKPVSHGSEDEDDVPF